MKLGDRMKRKGPEYETIVGFGPNLLNDNSANTEPEMKVKLINAVCGQGWTLEQMLKCDEHGWILKMAINNRM